MRSAFQRFAAKRQYCERLEELRGISTLLRIPVRTLRRWKSEDRKKGIDWDAERAEYIAASSNRLWKIAHAVVKRLEPMLERISPPKAQSAEGVPHEQKELNSSEIQALRVLLQSAKVLKEDL